MLAGTTGVPTTVVYQLTTGAPVLADMDTFQPSRTQSLVRFGALHGIKSPMLYGTTECMHALWLA